MAQTSAPAARPGYLRRIWPVVATLLLLAGLSGCGGESPEVLPPTAQAPAQETPQTTVLPTPTTTEELRSDRDRDKSPPATRADLRELVQGNNDFAFDLYRALSDGEGNLFYSPFSISQALAMTFAGAGGETERQMADTLHYRLPQSSLHPTFNALDRTLASRGKDPRGTPKPGRSQTVFPPEHRQRRLGTARLRIPPGLPGCPGRKLRSGNEAPGLRGRAGGVQSQDQRLGRRRNRR